MDYHSIEERQKVHLEKIKALKQQGITGFSAVFQICDDEAREQNKAEDSPLGRVAWAFQQMPYLHRVRLLKFANVLAAEQEKTVSINGYLAFDKFTQDERAYIALALKEMGDIRQDFPKNLKFWEFHQQRGNDDVVKNIANLYGKQS
ncbi:hypothetical protein ACWIUH_06715 [Ursidibacter arcticus]